MCGGDSRLEDSTVRSLHIYIAISFCVFLADQVLNVLCELGL